MNMRYKGYIWWAWLLLVLFSCTESEQAIEPVNPGGSTDEHEYQYACRE